MRSVIICLLSFFVSASISAQNQNPKLIVSPDGHTAKIRSLLFTPDGKLLISVSEDKSVRFWDYLTGEERYSFHVNLEHGPEGMLYAADLSDDGRWLAVGGYHVESNHNFFLIDISEIEQTTESKKAWRRRRLSIDSADLHTDIITTIDFSHQGETLYMATGSADRTVKIWEISNQTFALKNTLSFESEISSVSFSYDSASISLAVADDTKYIKIFTDDALFQPNASPSIAEKHYYEVNTVAFSPDGKWLISGGADQIVNLFDAKGRFVKKLGKLDNSVTSLSISPDSKYVVALGDVSGHGQAYSLPSEAEKKTIKQSVFEGHDNTVFASAFSPKANEGSYLVASAGGNDNEILVWNAITGRLTRPIRGNGNAIWQLEFREFSYKKEEVDETGLQLLISSDPETDAFSQSFNFAEMLLTEITGEVLSTAKKGDRIKKIDSYQLRTGGMVGLVTNNPTTDGRILAFAPFNLAGLQKVAIGSDFSLRVVHETGKTTDLLGHNGAVRALTVTPDQRFLASSGEDHIIHIWNLDQLAEQPETLEPFASLFVSRDNEWVLWSPEGYFVSSEQGSSFLGWYDGERIDAKFYKVEQFFDLLYRPKELQESFRDHIPVRELIQENVYQLNDLKKPPSVYVEDIYKTISEDNTPSLPYNDNGVLTSDKQEATFVVSAFSGGGGIKAIQIYQNGKLAVNDEDVRLAEGESELQRKYTLALLPETNDFKVQAINFEGTAALPEKKSIFYTGKPGAASNLYIFTIGINEYVNSKYKLSYARNDAEALLAKIKERSGPIFGNIFEYSLYDADGVKPKIEAKFKEIIEKARIQDTFIFYYAGHGTIDEDSKEKNFYLVPHDVTTLYGDSEQLQSLAVSDTQLRNWLAKIQAQKQLILLDACHSGGAVNAIARRGAVEEKAIFQLARSSGVVLISASNAQQTAAEVNQFEHGLFTYAMLQALDGIGLEKDKKSEEGITLTVNQLKAYIEREVPELSRQYSNSAQYPTGFSTGQDFPIGLIKE